MKEATFTFRLDGQGPELPVAIFNQAQGFYLAGSRCLLDVEVGPGETQCFVAPGVVNLCFAIELFLKSILSARHRPVPKTHKLLDLAEELPPDDLAAIREAFTLVVSDPRFDDFLQLVNDYFVTIRYEYEVPAVAFLEAPIHELAKATYLHAARLHGVPVGVERQ